MMSCNILGKKGSSEPSYHVFLELEAGEELKPVKVPVSIQCWLNCQSTLQPLYDMVPYNMVLDISGFKDGSQKCIDYIEK